MPISDAEQALRDYLKSVIEYDAKLKELLNRGCVDCQNKIAQDLDALQTYIKDFATNVTNVYRGAIEGGEIATDSSDSAVGKIYDYTNKAIEKLNSCKLNITTNIEDTAFSMEGDPSAKRLSAKCENLLKKVPGKIQKMELKDEFTGELKSGNCTIGKLVLAVETQLTNHNRRVIPDNLDKKKYIDDIVAFVDAQGGFEGNT